ncbi:hypothetical protein EDEG_01762 [Edhazardia aedis USNM 41457]|uniref:Uncharacterized protein n=1 Tax=Edhazardia aedis (strain USNM 41457) TaxID=1003232 RepID=J8ZW85_EDHAE|nr:hypothetical protein EDEG_01762 [Edhazardia aedis USNM 41457]|eukprot:EJW03953.1 hypothetical protein EDEG_01762 [Edhazardia aedis USNM 41457]
MKKSQFLFFIKNKNLMVFLYTVLDINCNTSPITNITKEEGVDPRNLLQQSENKLPNEITKNTLKSILRINQTVKSIKEEVNYVVNNSNTIGKKVTFNLIPETYIIHHEEKKYERADKGSLVAIKKDIQQKEDEKNNRFEQYPFNGILPKNTCAFKCRETPKSYQCLYEKNFLCSCSDYQCKSCSNCKNHNDTVFNRDNFSSNADYYDGLVEYMLTLNSIIIDDIKNLSKSEAKTNSSLNTNKSNTSSNDKIYLINQIAPAKKNIKFKTDIKKKIEKKDDFAHLDVIVASLFDYSKKIAK